MIKNKDLEELAAMLEDLEKKSPRLYTELSAALCAYAKGYLEMKSQTGQIIKFPAGESCS